MAIPTTREQFKKYCLRKLGHPVIKIDVTDEQVDDRIDEALNKYMRQHYDGSEKVYLAHQLTQAECDTKTIVLDDTILGVIDVFQIGWSTGSTGGLLFNVPYQILMNEVFSSSGGGMSPAGGISSYAIMRTSLEEIGQYLVGKFPFRYSEKTDTLYLDCAPEKLVADRYVVIEAYKVSDPEVFPDVWGDLWLTRYATALIKQQWGTNLSKFDGQRLPGDVVVRGVAIASEAASEIEMLEEELIRTYSPVLHDMIG